MASKKSLAVALSKLKGFSSPKIGLEQYETESEIAASLLWHAYMNNNIEGRIVCDIGAGTGILGLGAMILGASRTIFIEKDNDAIMILNENLKDYDKSNYSIIAKDITDVNVACDTVIMNPPFGAQNKGADRPFLKFCFENAKKSYAILPEVSIKFYEAYSKEHGKDFRILENAILRLPKMYGHHTKNTARIRVLLAVFE